MLRVCLTVVFLRRWLGRLRSVANSTALRQHENQYDDAEKLLLEAIEGCRLKLGDIHPYTLESWHELINLYEALNKPEKAKEWRVKLPQVEKIRK